MTFQSIRLLTQLLYFLRKATRYAHVPQRRRQLHSRGRRGQHRAFIPLERHQEFRDLLPGSEESEEKRIEQGLAEFSDLAMDSFD